MVKRDVVEWLVAGATIAASFFAVIAWLFPEPLQSGMFSWWIFAVAAGAILLVVLTYILWKALQRHRLVVTGFVLISSLVFTWIGTQLARPLQSKLEDRTLPIEAIPSIAHSYLADDPGQSSSSRLIIIMGRETGITYDHEYVFPDNAPGFAGIIFEFEKPRDLSSYATVELMISLVGSPEYCSFALGDTTGKQQEIPCQGPFSAESGITAKINEGWQTIAIPLHENFGAITLESVGKAYTVIVPGDAQGEVDSQLTNIRFIRP